ncbi:hypothetical protein DOTSEDRAFT_69649 [Dothistroma septosporum NZE10]|uniref:Uncharacterized protein n=1 Tax=Dothistroma septosporum (strain NZE10 / CBS 128990) TaxID=675120 RepID=N1PW83_DOTSN|nr:hypothetical protein DOTSEDRAFT_69649 [Dothistroma septosporum NZE10]
MPAAVVKGIILSISLIAALGIAVLENPQVQEWLEEQRRKVAELLRQIGQELDPESRRAAEAFAFEGRTIDNDEGLRREASGSEEAAALATGRSLSNPSTIRRVPAPGHVSPIEAEERRRKGREYLARRNQQMYELQQRRDAATAAGTETPPSLTFDSLVDDEGKLKPSTAEEEKELPSPPMTRLQPDPIREEMREIDRSLTEPLLADGSSPAGASGWSVGSYFANPFGDEYALERTMTPKPPLPPKIELDRVPSPPTSVPERAATSSMSLPGAYEAMTTERSQQVDRSQLSYEEQLAIALSLSEQESSANSATVRQNESGKEDDALLAAIAASLKDMDDQQAAHAIAHSEASTPQPSPMDTQPLIDLTPSTPPTRPRNTWDDMPKSPQFSASREVLTLPASTAARSEASDDLYSATPELTRARLAQFDAQQIAAVPSSTSSLPFDPVRDAAMSSVQPVWDIMDASFYSAADIASAPASARSPTLDRETSHLIDVDDGVPRDEARTPTSRAQSCWGFQTDSDTDTFASMSGSAPRAQSAPRSEASTIEVIDIAEDSDVDMVSEEGDGIATPDSWSEVGSRDAESDAEENTRQQSRESF